MTARIWVPSTEEWDGAWTNCPFSTYFHGREWAEIWSEYSNGRIVPDPLGIVLQDGTAILLPFSKERILGGRAVRHLSSPAGTFGGWLCTAHLEAEQQRILVDLIVQRYPDLWWRLNPYEEFLAPRSVGSLMDDDTQVLDLSRGFEAIYHSWTKGHRSAVRQARKAGVYIGLAQGRDDWAEYFRVYGASLDRWGKAANSGYTWHLFETIFRRDSPNVRLWLARHGGSVIAGALCFYAPTHVVYWHGAALSSHFGLRPVNLLIFEAIRDAAERGFRWFDFNPSSQLSGVRAFKRSFGTVTVGSPVIVRTSVRVKVLSRFERIISRAPR